jgi:hypothetical protein
MQNTTIVGKFDLYLNNSPLQAPKDAVVDLSEDAKP